MSQPTNTTSPIRPSSPTLAHFLDRNHRFASTCDPELLVRTAQGQSPSVFWLGCSDSRVPEGVVISAGVGEVFVHRNVANVFNPADTSATAALAYAVNHLKVTHVVVVGHESCGGCAAALASASAPQPSSTSASLDVGEAAIARWIDPIRQLVLSKREAQPNLTLSQLVAENVRVQVQNLIEHEVVQKAWARSQPLAVHGWIYDLASGKVTDLGVSQSAA